MLENDASDRTNFRIAILLAGSVATLAAAAGWGLATETRWRIMTFAGGFVFAAMLYWSFRRHIVRRRRVLKQPFDHRYRAILNSEVAFYQSLDQAGKTRFENLAKIFLDEVAITGINEVVDAQVRILVAASAIIPIFGFEDFEYSGLGEVLIYPGSFNDRYETQNGADRNIAGMVGTRHLGGVMILSKPSLIAGFSIQNDKSNVGIHEFAHLVDKHAGEIDGVPSTAPNQTIDPWVRWVGEELKREGSFADINDYAYTNAAEYFAVLSEYFFDSPAQLQNSHPKIYRLMRQMYHQDTKGLLGGQKRKRRRVGRNDPCPCGSGEKYKRCCRRQRSTSS